MKISVMEVASQGVVKYYAVKEFLAKFIFVNLQLKAIKDRNNIEGAIVNIVSQDEHVEDTEQFIRVLKEQARCYNSCYCVPKYSLWNRVLRAKYRQVKSLVVSKG